MRHTLRSVELRTRKGNVQFLMEGGGSDTTSFPTTYFAKLGGKIANALKPGGQFVVKYADGFYEHTQENGVHTGAYQEAPERITFRFKQYLPDVGAIVNTIRNETCGEEYERQGYIYTAPIVQLAMGNALELEQHITLDASQFLDVFVRT